MSKLTKGNQASASVLSRKIKQAVGRGNLHWSNIDLSL